MVAGWQSTAVELLQMGYMSNWRVRRNSSHSCRRAAVVMHVKFSEENGQSGLVLRQISWELSDVGSDHESDRVTEKGNALAEFE